MLGGSQGITRSGSDVTLHHQEGQRSENCWRKEELDTAMLAPNARYVDLLIQADGEFFFLHFFLLIDCFCFSHSPSFPSLLPSLIGFSPHSSLQTKLDCIG